MLHILYPYYYSLCLNRVSDIFIFTELVEPCSLPDVTSGHDLDTLLDLFSSLRHSPPTLLYRQLCHCIALILIHNGASDTWKIAYYLTEAQAITFRHKALLTWRSKLR